MTDLVRKLSTVSIAAAATLLTGLFALLGAGAAPVAAQPWSPDPGGAADGALPPGVTLSPYDLAHPAVGGLDPALRQAVQEAARAAAADGIELRITSGWRSPELQQRMFDDAVYSHGSVDAARRWVATPAVSRHVTGRAVDIGPGAAAEWLNRHGARFGLCRTYANEMWHYELTADASGVCPPLLPDASVDVPPADTQPVPGPIAWPADG